MKSYGKKKIKRGLAAASMVSCLFGCSRGLPMISEYKEQEPKTYTMQEMMLVVANERNRYEQVYTSQVWEVAVDEEGTTYKDYLLQEIKTFLEEMATINLLAEEQEISLTDAEKESLYKLSAAYYSSLTEEDRSYIQAEQEDIYQMYEEYCLANKVIEELTKDIDMEISDSEAKVISVSEIRTDTRSAAQEAWNKLQQEDADFAVIAKTYSLESQKVIQVGKGERGDEYDEVVFALAKDEISGIIRTGEGFYIVKCISDYDMEATQQRKENLSLKRRSQAFRKIYNQFAGEHQVTFDEALFDNLVFSAKDKTTTTEFFRMYQNYMEK